jgi:Lrp/AsnC family transcriptional regulator for asnA, asnC and gidA
MEKLNLLILSELEKDAQIPFVEIARKLGVSTYTIRKHYYRMKKEGTIQKCTVNIDLSKLGYQGKAFLWITIASGQSKDETMSALEKMRNVILFTEIIGAFDLLAIAPVTDLKSIQTLVDEVKSAPNVERVEITLNNDTCFPVYPSFGLQLSKKSYELAKG